MTPDKSAYLYWNDTPGTQAIDKAIGPAIALRVEAGYELIMEAFVRYEHNPNITHDLDLTLLASLLDTTFVGTLSVDNLPTITNMMQIGLSAAGSLVMAQITTSLMLSLITCSLMKTISLSMVVHGESRRVPLFYLIDFKVFPLFQLKKSCTSHIPMPSRKASYLVFIMAKLLLAIMKGSLYKITLAVHKACRCLLALRSLQIAWRMVPSSSLRISNFTSITVRVLLWSYVQ